MSEEDMFVYLYGNDPESALEIFCDFVFSLLHRSMKKFFFPRSLAPFEKRQYNLYEHYISDAKMLILERMEKAMYPVYRHQSEFERMILHSALPQLANLQIVRMLQLSCKDGDLQLFANNLPNLV